MSGIATRLKLPTQEEARKLRPLTQKCQQMPRQLVKKAERKSKADRGKAFRDEVWARDGGKCRATGKRLLRSGTVDWDELGEVDHAYLRSTSPDRIYDTSNGLLLTKSLNRLRKVVCREQPEFHVFDYSGPDNRALPQWFTWRDPVTGRITKEREG